MAIKDYFKVFLFPDPLTGVETNEGYEDITSGILNVELSSGSDIYEGPQQQIDSGQFTIVTRNPAMDPSINPNLKYNSRISFFDNRLWPDEEALNLKEFYRGYVTDINVEYVRNDNPIITITGTDIFGVLQRTTVNETLYNEVIALSDGPSWDGVDLEKFINMPTFIQLFTNKYYTHYMTTWAFVPGTFDPGGEITSSDNFIKFVGNSYFKNVSPEQPDFQGLLGYAPAKYIPEVGQSFLEVINKYNETNLNYITPKSESADTAFYYITLNPFPKYDGTYWPALNWSPDLPIEYFDFSSDPTDDASYDSVVLDNGFNSIINQVEVSNEYKTVVDGEIVSHQENFSYGAQESIEDYAVSRLNLSTIVPESDGSSISASTRWIAQNIFQLVSDPSNQLKKITFDNEKRAYSEYTINNTVAINHKINDDKSIRAKYDIAGVTHSIAPDRWETTFTLKPNVYDFVGRYQGYTPTIEMNATSGDANFNFTATITDYPIEDIQQVFWCLNATDYDSYDYFYASTINGERYKDGNPRLGLTQTWNFDDDGILAPYDVYFNRYGGYGPGRYWVYAYILLKNRFMICVQQELIVGTPEVEADFVWTQNITTNFGQVQFTDTSVNHEVGEPDSYLWTFGDGTTSTERNPIKVYNPSGPTDTEFDVSLRVFTYGEYGEKVYNTKTQTVTLTQPTMIPDFTSSATYQTIAFTNTSQLVGLEEPDAYFWEFGDGTTSTLKNPVHTFPVTDINYPESYEVTLTTRNIWEQTASITKTITTTALNKTGTFPVRYIKFKIDEYTKSGTFSGGRLFAINPVMSNLKAVTSNTGANLTYNRPLVGFNDNSIPRMRWYSTSGDAVQSSRGWDYFLTRDIQGLDPLDYGDGPASQQLRALDGPYQTVRWELVVDLLQPTQLINDILLRFEDLFVRTGTYAGLHVESFYPKISVEFASTVTTVTPNPSGVYGPGTLEGDWVNVGYIKLDGGRMDPTKPVGQRTNTTKSLTKLRVLPLNIPYFTYTFDDKTVYFESVETADSYAWTFGDGTTSTDKDPVKTYASYGTYTVTLEVTNDGVVTRTTTEPVVVQAAIL